MASGYVDQIHDLVSGIDPGDDREAQDRADALAWIGSGAPLCRTVKPATPPEHLVSYTMVVDPHRHQALLVDHKLSGLWLPAGGHVDPGEHPETTARRELREELDLDAPYVLGRAEPLMVTRCVTVGLAPGHTDVSFWYCFAVDADQPIWFDEREFHGIRWWPFADVRHGPATRFDPNLPRFITKLTSLLP